jgi:hypothetical protein
MNACTHAAVRAQQRGLPPLIDQWLDQFGEEAYDDHGGIVRYFSHGSRRALERTFGRAAVRKLAEYLDAYKVEDSHDGRPITTGHRFKRINRK